MSILRSLRCAGLFWAAVLLACSIRAGEPTKVARPARPGPARPEPEVVAHWKQRLAELRRPFESTVALEAEEAEAAHDRWRAQVAAIDDPAAIPIIVTWLETERHGQFRRALIQPLISLGGDQAVACLVKWSVEDPNPYLRREACHGLVGKEELPKFLDAYLEYFKPVRQGLHMQFATEAAEALMMTELAAPLEPDEPPDPKIVRALVGALDSAKVHIKQIDVKAVKDFIPDPRDSEERQKRRTPLAGLPEVDTPNPVVLATLESYTGEKFQYHKQAWLRWLDHRLAQEKAQRLVEQQQKERPKAPILDRAVGNAMAPWREQLLAWKAEYYGEGGREEEGRAKIEAIDDPAAIPAMVALLQSEQHGQLRRALIVPLAKLGGKEALDCLVKWSVEDENPLLREEAAKSLAGRPELDSYLDKYIAYLKSPKFVASAAEAILWTQIGKPQSQSQPSPEKLTRALIDAIHTVQVKRVPYRVAFDTGKFADPGVSSGINHVRGIDAGWTQVKVPVPQPKVVEVLKTYTGGGYEYDEAKWREHVLGKKRTSK